GLVVGIRLSAISESDLTEHRSSITDHRPPLGAILPKRSREARLPAPVPPAGRVLPFTGVTLWPARLPSYSSKTTTTIFASIQRFSRTPATTCSRQLTVRRGWRSRGAVSRT